MSVRTLADDHSDLSRERLLLLGEVALEVWDGSVRDHREDADDGPLVLGVRFFERMLARLRRMALEHPWMRVIEKGMHFVFSAGAVPLRVYRGTVRILKKRYRARNPQEVQAHTLAFAFMKEELETCYRLVVEEIRPEKGKGIDADGKRTRSARVVLVKYAVATGSPLDALDLKTLLPIGLPTKVGNLYPPTKASNDAARGARVKPMQPPQVEMPKPSVGMKKKGAKKKGTGSDGTA